MQRKLIATFLILLILVNPLYASESLINLYLPVNSSQTADFNKPEELADFSKKTLELWTKITDASFETNEVETEDGKYLGRLIDAQGTPVLEITEKETGIVRYHSLEGKQATLNINGTETTLKKFSLDEIASTEAIISMEQVQKEYEKIPKELREKEKRQFMSPEAWSEKAVNTLSDVHTIYLKTLDYWKKLRDENSALSDEEFQNQFIKRDKVQIHFAEGMGEINQVNGTPFVRIVHNRTELAFIVKDKNVDEDSSSFQRYVARQHVMAGHARRDGEIGRDLVFINVEKIEKANISMFSNPADYSFSFRHPKSSPLFWKDYFKAIYEKPTKTTFYFGLFSGTGQALAATGVAFLKYFAEPGSQMDLVFAPALSFVWGTVIGTYINTYRNLLSFGTPTAKIVKAAANTVLFYYTLYFLTHPGGFMEALGSLNPLEITGLMINISAITNIVAGNLSKPHWNEITYARERAGIVHGPFKVKIGEKIKVFKDLSRAAFENQVLYWIPFSIQLMDRLHLYIGPFPAGKTALIGSIVAIEYFLLKYLENLSAKFGDANPKLKEMANIKRANWEMKKSFFTDSHMRKLVLKRLRAKLSFNREMYLETSKMLNAEYPHYFNFDVREKGELTMAEHFEVPGQELPYRKPKAQSRLNKCTDNLKIILGTKIF